MKIKPNIAQKDALLGIRKSKKVGNNRFLVVLPSGVGKTHLSAFDTQGFDGKILYISHRREINEQAMKSFHDVHGIDFDEMGVFGRNKKQVDKKVIFATIQAIGRVANLKKFKRCHFGYIILDEYHHVSAPSYQRVVNYFKPEFLLGLTATPFRYDRQDIFGAVESNIPFKMTLQDGIKKELLVPFKYYGLWDDIDYSKIKWSSHGYRERDLDKTLLIKKRDISVIREFKKIVGTRTTIGFCCSVKHVERCVRKFRQAGISCAGITHKTPQNMRADIVRLFRVGKYQVIFTKDIFNEGVDFPEASAILLLRPTFSKTVFLQQIGRGLRRAKGKKNVIILDFIGNYVNAFRVGKWIKEVLGLGNQRPTKPVYHHNIYGSVTFNKKLVKLFERQELHHRKFLDKESMIHDYFRVKKKLGRQPRIKDMDVHSYYSSGSYTNFFGSWNEFLRVIKEDFLCFHAIGVTKRELKNNYFMFKKRLGHQPKMKEVSRKCGSRYDLKVYIRVFGAWNLFLKEIGEPFLMRTKYAKYQDEKKQMIKHYYRVKKKLGRVPTGEEMRNEKPYTDDSYKIAFGSWAKFMKHVGEPYRKLNISLDELMTDYHRVSKIVGKKLLTRGEYELHGRYTGSLYMKREGSFKNFVEKHVGKLPKIYTIEKCPLCGKQHKSWKSGPKIHCSMECYHLSRRI